MDQCYESAHNKYVVTPSYSVVFLLFSFQLLTSIHISYIYAFMRYICMHIEISI